VACNNIWISLMGWEAQEMKRLVINLKHCSDCPYYRIEDRDYCYHPAYTDFKQKMVILRQIGQPFPSGCPIPSVGEEGDE